MPARSSLVPMLPRSESPENPSSSPRSDVTADAPLDLDAQCSEKGGSKVLHALRGKAAQYSMSLLGMLPLSGGASRANASDTHTQGSAPAQTHHDDFHDILRSAYQRLEMGNPELIDQLRQAIINGTGTVNGQLLTCDEAAEEYGRICSEALGDRITNAAERIAPQFSEQPGAENGDRHWLPQNLHHTFPGRHGDLAAWAYFIASPLQFEMFNKDVTQGNAALTITPSEYARLFAQDPVAGNPLRDEDYRRIGETIGNWIESSFTDEVHPVFGWGVSRKAWERDNGGPPARHAGQVTDLTVSGHASPEGPQHLGPATLDPHWTDQENIELAMMRARRGAEIVKQVLKDRGIELNLASGGESLHHAELQCTWDEITRLSDEADRLSDSGETRYPARADELEKAWMLVVDYNNGKIKDPASLALLDEVVGSKRNVEVHMSYENGREVKHLLPVVPWLLLAIPLWRRRRQSEQQAQPNDPAGHDARPAEPLRPEPAHNPDTAPGSASQQRGAPRPDAPLHEPYFSPADHERIRSVRVAVPGTPEGDAIQEQALLEDIAKNFGPGSPVNYRRFVTEIDRRWAEFEDDAAREHFLTAVILQAWQDNDEDMRTAAQDTAQHAEHKDRPDQIMWAKAHAHELVEMAKDRRAAADRPEERPAYEDMLAARSTRFALRRHHRELMSSVTDEMRSTQLPPRDGMEYYSMRDEALIGDIAKHFLQPGEINYFAFASSLTRNSKGFADREHAHMWATSAVLKAWGEKDGADYTHDPRQILWAKIHADLVLEMSERQKTGFPGMPRNLGDINILQDMTRDQFALRWEVRRKTEG